MSFTLVNILNIGWWITSC